VVLGSAAQIGPNRGNRPIDRHVIATDPDLSLEQRQCQVDGAGFTDPIG
jgi:hypothetical protein